MQRISQGQSLSECYKKHFKGSVAREARSRFKVLKFKILPILRLHASAANFFRRMIKIETGTSAEEFGKRRTLVRTEPATDLRVK